MADEERADEGIPSEMLDLVRFLAQGFMEWHALRARAVGMSPDKCKEFLAMQFPTVQGTRNMRALEDIGAQAFDRAKILTAVDWLLEGDAAASSEQGEVFEEHQNGCTCADCAPGQRPIMGVTGDGDER